MSEELSTVAKQQKMVMDLVGEIKELKHLNEDKDRRIISLEGYITELEQYTRMNVVIICGLEIKPWSYARAVTQQEGEVHTDMDTNSLENKVTTFLTNKGIAISNTDIEACHPLPRKIKDAKPAINLRFTNGKFKNALLKQGKKLKGTEMYVNKHLTKKNAEIARKARILKKLRKIQSTWTANCKIFISKVLAIKHIEELEKYE
ncbi:uncharacterized protein [Nothobranchius furzeri]|uniref:uncharacterized protein n=1 Tax=Nothobranchius furzeri TaxID=105023 RepID=UPI00390495C7